VWLEYDEDTANLREIGQGIVDLIHNFDSNSAAIDSILGDPHEAAAAAGMGIDVATSPSTGKLLQASVEAVSVNDITIQ
jgi:hypothetical protein